MAGNGNIEEPGRSISVLGKPEYVDNRETTEGKQMPVWKSDLLIVLGARESRVHGEAASRVVFSTGRHELHAEEEQA